MKAICAELDVTYINHAVVQLQRCHKAERPSCTSIIIIIALALGKKSSLSSVQGDIKTVSRNGI